LIEKETHSGCYSRYNSANTAQMRMGREASLVREKTVSHRGIFWRKLYTSCVTVVSTWLFALSRYLLLLKRHHPDTVI
jgi:hypothetical protein